MNAKNILLYACVIFIISGYLYLAITPKKAPVKPQKPLSIGLCIMATGKYIHFANQLIRSAEYYFLPGHRRTFFVFTDQIDALEKNSHIVPIFQKRLGWPYDTMMRCAVYQKHKELFTSMNYLFACDADMLFVDFVGEEILSDLVGTLHPGFTYRRGTYENNSQSKAYVEACEGKHYFAGGFYGGSRERFIAMNDSLTSTIDQDLKKKIVAIWHDESHLNRYFIDHKPTRILDTSYCYFEGRSLPTPPRLVALYKSKTYWRS